MTIRKVAIVFDNVARPDTTGVYCRRALGTMVEVEHFLPTEVSRIPPQGFDLFLRIDDGLEYRLPANLHPCAWWVIDTHLNLPWYLTAASDVDFVFAAQRDGAEQLRKGGIDTVTWLPLGCDPDMHQKHPVEKTYDVCFVGHMFPGPRAELVALLQQHFSNSFFGQQFFEAMAKTYSASRIVFNRSLRNDINMRVFEALACGSLLITNNLADNGQEELFRDGIHLATYDDSDELLYKVRYYLGKEEVREKIAAAGREEVLAKHTYRQRMELLLRQVENHLHQVLPATCAQIGPQQPSRELSGQASFILTEKCEAPVGNGHSLASHQDPQPDLLSLIPTSAQKVLHIGCGTGALGAHLKARQGADVTGIEASVESARTTREILDQVIVGDLEQLEPGFAPALFDVIVCTDVVERLRHPLQMLRRAGIWLKSTGMLLLSIPNVRHNSLVQSLLEGNWNNEPAGTCDRGLQRFFTRREIEKLFFRAGFSIKELQVAASAEHEAWRQKGCPGEVNMRGLHIAGIVPEEAEEFYVNQYLVGAVPVLTPDPGLTSIVIVTHNQVEYTQQCINSIRTYTDEPYELIFVDNASTDNTVEFLRGVPNAKLIVNTENRGFPAATNQGIQAASGSQILLLNNDCLATTGWLYRLLRALNNDPKIGLVGPCSNCVSGEQQIPTDYNLPSLDGFAWQWGKINNRQLVDTDRLVGFCLLFRQELLEKIGLLDERFGIGCFEDDDYCRRAIGSGYRAVIARDAFVHHYGGRTFVGSGVDFASLMQKNQELFNAKWAESDIPQTVDPPPAEPVPPLPYKIEIAPSGGLLLKRGQIQLSLCMIVRDNARTIDACLRSVRPWVDEMIVVDTGSKDNTPMIAKNLGARVFHFPWCDSFSAARNESLRFARGRWLFWMDSDDTIDEANGRKLRELADLEQDPSILGYVMQVHCPGPGEDGETQVTIVDHVKLLRNLPGVRFEGRIHEQIIPAIRRVGGKIAWSDVYVVHSGYDHSPEGQEQKKQRDLKLLHLELNAQPNHPFTLFNLGMTHADLGEHHIAVGYLLRSIQNSDPGESHLRKAHALLVQSLQQLSRKEEAWQSCQQALRLFPQDAELLFRQASLLHDHGQLGDAVTAYEALLHTKEERHFSSVVNGIQGFLARHNLALIHTEMGNLPKAEEQWRLVVQEMPQYRPGWRGLGENLLFQRKYDEAMALADRLVVEKRPLRTEGRLLKGHVTVAQGNLQKARREFEWALKECPGDLETLNALCRFLFEYVDPAQAEQPIQELVRREPQNASHYHNLGRVYSRQGRHPEAVEAYRLSVKCRPTSAEGHVALGNALRSCNRFKEAIDAWEEAVRLDPGMKEATDALRQVNVFKLEKEPRKKQIASAEVTSMFPLHLPDRTVNLPFRTRGPVDRSIVAHIWERDTYGVRSISNPPSTVVDIGAHIGAFSVMAAEAWPEARVIACEADPENYLMLRENLCGRHNIETVKAAIIGQDLNEVEFNAVIDKSAYNSGGGTCVRDEPWTTKTRVPAMSVVRLWSTKGIRQCDLLKLDCEGAEVQILQVLADSRLLADVQLIVGEWHAEDDRESTRNRVKEELHTILQPTHSVAFSPNGRGKEGYFTARIRAESPTNRPPTFAKQ